LLRVLRCRCVDRLRDVASVCVCVAVYVVARTAFVAFLRCARRRAGAPLPDFVCVLRDQFFTVRLRVRVCRIIMIMFAVRVYAERAVHSQVVVAARVAAIDSLVAQPLFRLRVAFRIVQLRLRCALRYAHAFALPPSCAPRCRVVPFLPLTPCCHWIERGTFAFVAHRVFVCVYRAHARLARSLRADRFVWTCIFVCGLPALPRRRVSRVQTRAACVRFALRTHTAFAWHAAPRALRGSFRSFIVLRMRAGAVPSLVCDSLRVAFAHALRPSVALHSLRCVCIALRLYHSTRSCRLLRVTVRIVSLPLHDARAVHATLRYAARTTFACRACTARRATALFTFRLPLPPVPRCCDRMHRTTFAVTFTRLPRSFVRLPFLHFACTVTLRFCITHAHCYRAVLRCATVLPRSAARTVRCVPGLRLRCRGAVIVRVYTARYAFCVCPFCDLHVFWTSRSFGLRLHGCIAAPRFLRLLGRALVPFLRCRAPPFAFSHSAHAYTFCYCAYRVALLPFTFLRVAAYARGTRFGQSHSDLSTNTFTARALPRCRLLRFMPLPRVAFR